MLQPRSAAALCLLLACTYLHHAHARRNALPKLPARPQSPSSRKLLNPTSAGYLPVDKNQDSSMFYLYFEADVPAPDMSTAPIVLWLQGGPGCSSMFGAAYLNGPYYVQPDMSLVPNPGRWNRHYGTLYIDQPLGVGFSLAASEHIPRDELTAARDLYAALQAFYAAHPSFAKRPLYITGESYAGKYVPSITHYIIQAKAAAEGWEAKLRKRRALPPGVPPPVFELGGAAIGNGFTDAVHQTLVQGQVAWHMGLIDTRQLLEAEQLQFRIVEHVRSRQWKKARALSDQLLAFIANASDSKTLEDVRRDEAYDAADLTSIFYNLPHVQANIKAHPNTTYVSCSPQVDAAFGGDVMKSTANLVPDILEFSHLLLYQGQWDAECGVASNEAWISKLQWTGHTAFNTAPRHLWKDPTPGSPTGDTTLGYWKYHAHLTHMIIRNAGHMVPHDRPEVSQLMLESWIESTRRGEGEYDPAASQGLPLVRPAAAPAATSEADAAAAVVPLPAAAAAAAKPGVVVQ